MKAKEGVIVREMIGISETETSKQKVTPNAETPKSVGTPKRSKQIDRDTKKSKTDIKLVDENLGVVFLSKHKIKEDAVCSKQATSVDIWQKRTENNLSSRTMEIKKKMNRKGFKRKLRLNLKKSIKTIIEIPTIDIEMKNIEDGCKG